MCDSVFSLLIIMLFDLSCQVRSPHSQQTGGRITYGHRRVTAEYKYTQRIIFNALNTETAKASFKDAAGEIKTAGTHREQRRGSDPSSCRCRQMTSTRQSVTQHTWVHFTDDITLSTTECSFTCTHTSHPQDVGTTHTHTSCSECVSEHTAESPTAAASAPSDPTQNRLRC